MSDAMNPYQPAHVEPRHRRRSLVIVVSAAVGSILAIVVLSVVVRPSRSAPASGIELAPAAPLIDTSSTTSVIGLSPTTVPRGTGSSTMPPAPIATLGAPPSTVTVPSRWIPPDTPDFVRAVLLGDESLDVVARFENGTKAYFAVSRPGSATCGAIVYRVERGHDRELVSDARYLFPRGDGRWFVMATDQGSECRPGELTIVDTFNDTARALPAAGWFSQWSTVDARFVLYDYLIGRFTLYDAPSATSLRLGVSSAFVDELDERVGVVSDGRPGWIMGRIAFLAEGELVAHIQCLPEACPKKDSISGWFYVDDGQVIGESARVPEDKAPAVSFYCGV